DERDSQVSREAEGHELAAGGEGNDALRSAAAAAMRLCAADRNQAVPAAVQTLLAASEDPAEAAKMLASSVQAATSRLPAATAPLLAQVAQEIKDQQRSSSKVTQDDEDIDDDESDDQGGQHFMLGPIKVPLAMLISIANGLEPDDLTPAAGTCKSLCIAININLQYTYFLIRLLRLIVLGPELARAMGQEEESSSAGSSDGGESSTEASSGCHG
ncbi:unnamed protein product, partial [Polarella glacialis]